MTIKAKIKKALREHYGEFSSTLESQYEEKLIYILEVADMEVKKEWVTYNQVILELKNSLKDMLRVKELQYKLTDNINPSEACIEVLEQMTFKTPELERLYYKIRNF